MRAALISNSGATAVGIDTVNRQFFQRRRHLRYPIRVAVTVQWLARTGPKGCVKAKTKDISEGGAFVFSRVLPPLGAIVELTVQLPVKQTGAPSSRLEMCGEVYRVETPTGRESKWGFAINATKTVMYGPSSRVGLDKEE
jgi:PilZ domain